MSVLDKLREEKKKKKDKAQQDVKEAEIVSLIRQKYNASYSAKAKLLEQWRKNKEAYTGELFKQSLPDYKAKEVSNYVFSTIETIKPIMLSNYPKTIALPRSSNDFTKAKLVQNALDFEWKREKMFEKLTNFLHYILVYGTAAIYLPWNGEDNGAGNVNAVVVSPFNLFPDPRATSDRDAEYMMYAAYKPLGELCEAYPEKAEDIKAQATGTTDPALNDGESIDGRNMILYIECYMKDYAVEVQIEDELGEDDEPTGNKVKKKKRKYPNGRRVIIAGDILLDDGENPYKDGLSPFRTMRAYPLPDSYWGLSEVEHLISPQEHMSKLTNSILENAGLMGNPVWILDKNSGVEKGSLSNRPGLVIRKTPGTEVKRDAPPPIPTYTMQMVDVLKSDIERISGVFDVTRGERPAGISAAAAITSLQESAQGRIRLKTQLLEECISDIGAMWLSRMQQFWSTVRTIRVMGGNYKANEQSDMQFNEAMMGGQQMPMNPQGGAPINEPIDPALSNYYAGGMIANGKRYDFYDISKDDIDGDYDIEIVTGSTMSKNRAAMLQTLIQMAQTPAEDGMPMIDRQTLLENSDIPDVEDILERFEALKTQQQENMQAEQDAQMQINAQSAEAAEQAKMQTEQMKVESKMQEKELDIQGKMAIEQMKSQSNKEGKLMDILGQQAQSEMDNTGDSTKTLQTQQDDVQLNEEDGANQLQQIIETLASLPPEELEALRRQNPDIDALLRILEQLQGEMVGQAVDPAQQMALGEQPVDPTQLAMMNNQM